MSYSAILAMSLGVSCAAAGTPVTTWSLIEEMVDLHRLTRFPALAYKTVQFSSYDRRSAVPGGQGWFANSDGFGEEPVPNFEAVLTPPTGEAPGEYLMCDVVGPGAIVRLWSADIAGTVRVFLDDAETPLYDGPAKEFFLHPYNQFLEGSGVSPAMLDGTFYERDASYAPIPFARRCRIVWTGNHKDIHFYHIQIRKYEACTPVITFTPGDILHAMNSIKRVAAIMRDIDALWPYRSSREPVEFSLTVPPHSMIEGMNLKGGGAIERLVLKVKASRQEDALRQTILHVQCDEHPWGEVQSPIGDFFGAGPGINPFSSIPFSVESDGTMTCRFAMPYRDSLRILFDNRGGQEVTITGSVLPTDYTWDSDSMYFRARWRVDHNLVASDKEEMGGQDIPFLLARGRGVYVGTAIMLLNPNNVPTSWGNWWGEGDEKVFVDDDVRPSIFGTGSEDYFNYSWSANDIFAFPYCGQPRNDGPANRGFVTNYRWHILDPLPFAHNIAFYMELLSHERTAGFSYARVSYHYGCEGIIDDHIAIKDDDVKLPSLPETWEPAARFGAAHCVFSACEGLVADKTNTAIEDGPLWQGGRILVWQPKQKGDTLTLGFDVEEEGKYDLSLVCMFRPDGGEFQAELDGVALPFDGKASTNLASPHHVMSRMLGTGALSLKVGEHALTLTAVTPGNPIGLDFFGSRKH